MDEKREARIRRVDTGTQKDALTSDRIHYSNCWEDANILLQALAIQDGGKYLSIASAGDNTLSLLTGNPSLILAIDASPSQIACLEIRKLTFQKLSYDDTLKFLGIVDGFDRISFYKQISSHLTKSSKQFWDNHMDFIEGGIIHSGKFENYFHLFRRRILPFIISRRRCRELLDEKSQEERISFYENKLNSWRWRALFRVFFSRAMMGHLGREPEFFKYVKGNVAGEILQRAKYAITALPTYTNSYLEYIVKGNFENALPHYLQKENFHIIKENLCKLKIFRGYLSDALKAYPEMKFDGSNLSDIFEYMSYHQYLQSLDQVVKSSKRGARLVYWNMMVSRNSPEAMRNRLKPLYGTAQDLLKKNRAFFYRSLVIEEVQ